VKLDIPGIIAKIPEKYPNKWRYPMKETKINPLKVWLFLVLLLAPAVLAAAENQTAGTPAAVAPETVYEFPDTPDGEYVVHDFVIRNQGDAVLNVLKVKTT